MAKPRILVTGASGMLGSAVMDELINAENEYEVFATQHDRPLRSILPPNHIVRIDLNDLTTTNERIAELKLDAVIHCAALINLAICESQFEMALRLNVLATKSIVEGALLSNPNCSIIYISSDAVYPDVEGQKPESLTAQPTTMYGLSKKWGEDIVRIYTEKALILRTTVIGPDRGQFFMWINDHAHSDKEINLFTDVTFTPISVRLAGKTILQALKREVYGIYNMGSSDQITKAAFADKVLNYLKASCARKYSSLRDFPSTIKRSCNMALDSSRLKNLTGCSYTIEESIHDVFDQIQRNINR